MVVKEKEQVLFLKNFLININNREEKEVDKEELY